MISLWYQDILKLIRVFSKIFQNKYEKEIYILQRGMGIINN